MTELCPDCRIHPAYGHLLGCSVAAATATDVVLEQLVAEEAQAWELFVARLLYGNSFETADARRIDPANVSRVTGRT